MNSIHLLSILPFIGSSIIFVLYCKNWCLGLIKVFIVSESIATFSSKSKTFLSELINLTVLFFLRSGFLMLCVLISLLLNIFVLNLFKQI
ncbi:hypothetical protein A0H76_2670 [Hepatospora eriocheir]|uniref:Uncharacterized protein n=1 Tax=Hepatospora eriocheir TaxID=1081669 RepID=A0A1X0Q6G5_9MICR|nr:hypothetical protein HERIO_2552 [Hepatospora eriocheir]ORD98347.1 hypothetical protein A0H76_2670 [Hepatospora eriocheir]